MIQGALTTTSQTWVNIQHVGTIIAAFGGAVAAVRTVVTGRKVDSVHVLVNGKFSATVDRLADVTSQLETRTTERDQARAGEAAALAQVDKPPTS